MLREELVPAGHRHSTCGFEESEGDAHPLTPQALTPGPWGNLRPFLLGHWRCATLGAPPETDWTYDIRKFAEKPPAQAYTDAKQDLVSSYARVPHVLQQMQGCLASGYPFVFGFTVYESFESENVAKTGIVPMPGSGEGVVGGHCVVAVGYDDAKRVFIVRNSWGTKWGIKGYCMMPYEYLVRPLSSDFWTIRSVTG